MSDYPNDADGDALRHVANGGSDMTKPMEIDFHVAAPDEQRANLIKSAVEELPMIEGRFDVRVVWDDESETWTVWCTRMMLPAYIEILRIQAMLNRVSRPHDGFSDGWGTLGNCRKRPSN